MVNFHCQKEAAVLNEHIPLIYQRGSVLLRLLLPGLIHLSLNVFTVPTKQGPKLPTTGRNIKGNLFSQTARG